MTKQTHTASSNNAANASAVARLPDISVAIKAALAVSHSSDAARSHAQVLDAVAKELGFKNFRALKALEKLQANQPVVGPAVTPPLLVVLDAFESAHPGMSLELSVPMRDSEDADLPCFKFVLNREHLQKLIQMTQSSKSLKSPVNLQVGGMPVGREGTNVSLCVASLEGNDWMGFETLTFHKYGQEYCGSQGDLAIDDLKDAIQAASQEDLADLEVGSYRVLNNCTVLYRVDETTLRLACEFTQTEDYLCHGQYPSEEDCVTLKGVDYEAAPEDILTGFAAAVIQEDVLAGRHENEG